MSSLAGLTSIALLLSLASSSTLAESVHWQNGQWFDGSRFVAGERYSVDGVLHITPPDKIDRHVDLAGRHVVPAFGDAHHHGIDGERDLETKIQHFLRDGIFYVKNPNVIPDLLTAQVRQQINHAASIDVAFANGGLTSSGGHPQPLHRYLSENGIFPGLGPEDMENRAYFIIDDEADLDAKWPLIRAGKPDFIKTFLLFADADSIDQGATRHAQGLSPAMLPLITQRAHGDGLRVSTHIDTAADFRLAVAAGVDEINHLPLPDLRFSADLSVYLIDQATAQRAADQGTVVVTTVSVRERLAAQALTEPVRSQIRDNQRENLRRLHAAGVRVAIGSDGISGETPIATARQEIDYLRELDAFDNATLLRWWSEYTPQTIFPARKIGRLESGYEANFLVLDGDPMEDWSAVTRIVSRVKGGKVLDASAVSPRY